MKFKAFSVKARQSLHNDLNLKSAIEIILGIGFGTTLRPKANVLHVSK